MEEIEFIKDPEGNLTYHIKGVKGKKCEDIEKALADLGETVKTEKTGEYYQQETVGIHTRK